jgi:hypothetical protein
VLNHSREKRFIMALDTGGNVQVDFVWGNYPLQPNDIRTEEAAVNIGGTTGSNAVSYKTAVVTAASGNGTTITYTASNSFVAGQTVTITGLTTSGANLTDAVIATATTANFTVTNATSVSDTAQTAVAKVVENVLPGVGADASWSATTQVTGARLDAALDNHANAEAGWSGYPSFTPGAANYIVTAATGNGTTVTYTSQNNFVGGETVNITGLTASAYNLSSATVASADALDFTVTNAANAGLITGQYGKVQSTTALTAFDGAGIGYINVPSVLGDTTAVALDELKDAGYETANITTAAGATNTATQPTQINVTTTTAATVTVSGGTSTWPVGTKVTIAAGTGIPTALVGTWTVTGGSGSTLVIAGSGWTVADTGAITPGTRLTGTAGTIKTQSTAAAAASVLTTATITITPWA